MNKRMANIVEKVALYGDRTWLFGKQVEAMVSSLGNVHGRYVDVKKVVGKMVVIANGTRNLDNDKDVSEMVSECESAKKVLSDMSAAVSKMLNAVEEYEDELMFRVKNSGVAMRG